MRLNGEKMGFKRACGILKNNRQRGIVMQNMGHYPVAWWKGGKLVVHPNTNSHYRTAIEKAVGQKSI